MREMKLSLISFGRSSTTLPSILFLSTNKLGTLPHSTILVLGIVLNILGIIYCMIGFDVLYNWSV